MSVIDMPFPCGMLYWTAKKASRALGAVGIAVVYKELECHLSSSK